MFASFTRTLHKLSCIYIWLNVHLFRLYDSVTRDLHVVVTAHILIYEMKCSGVRIPDKDKLCVIIAGTGRMQALSATLY